ncbi:mitochondrial biogenesis AIM24-domain-containing protein [Mycotypha africana]|uniref:mitochondrial biogenesis AIM24-domain-containing protein n=1 Tax=Mycotypha africana TaxID=64632 RepID=UPI00230029C1|nr:mitochondrial biogenesis AIM24-domain-containing protein [Mycotypha africana]KAI8982487.1 mitochondrial biogenesis AIM24-domain-containing protein [Mycotypha africana]
MTIMYKRALPMIQWAQRREYVGLVFNKVQRKETVDTVDRSLKSFEHTVNGPSDTISKVGSDIDMKIESEPIFEVVSAGVGSALLVKLPPNASITTAAGSALAASVKIKTKLSLDNKSMLKSVSKKALGDRIFFQKHTTEDAPGDLLLAPQQLGEITVIQLKNSAKYMLRRNAFLAKTEKVSLDLGLNMKETGITNKLIHTVSGPGTLAISHYGGIYRITLAAGEEYQANPLNLIMWDKRTNPTQLHSKKTIIPSPRSPLRQYDFFRHIVDSPSLQPKLQYLYNFSRAVRNFLLGTPDFVKLKGPGDFYIASRLQPRFERSRLTNALAAMTDSVLQKPEQFTADIFPSAPVDVIENESLIKKKHREYAQKSTDGHPSYIAEIGPQGSVTFTTNVKNE